MHVPLTQPWRSLRRTPDEPRTYLFIRILRIDGRIFGLSRGIITVVQSAQAIMGNHATGGYAASSAAWYSVAQSKMGAVVVVKAMGSQPIRTAYRSRWQNGIAERWVGSVRRELLNHVIVLNRRHLRRLLNEYVRGRVPALTLSSGCKVVSLPRLGGLHQRYKVAA